MFADRGKTCALFKAFGRAERVLVAGGGTQNDATLPARASRVTPTKAVFVMTPPCSGVVSWESHSMGLLKTEQAFTERERKYRAINSRLVGRAST